MAPAPRASNVRIQPGSAKIHVTEFPRVLKPVIDGTDMAFKCTPIRADGEVTLLGDPADSAEGWTAGFIQAQWIETNWSYYRGAKNSDGSIFIQRARPPARKQQACRDVVKNTPVNDIWYSTRPGTLEIKSGTAADVFPLKLSIKHGDKPDDFMALVEMNGSFNPPRPNFLTEAQLEFHFCTILSVRDPDGNFHHQASFYWNMHWEATFQPTTHTNPPADFRINVIKSGTAANVGHLIKGAPTDRRFTGVLTSAQTDSCNDLADAEADGNRHEAKVWANWDVRKP